MAHCICPPRKINHALAKRDIVVSSMIYIAVIVYGYISSGNDLTMLLGGAAFIAILIFGYAGYIMLRKHTFKCALYTSFTSPSVSVFDALNRHK